MRQSRNSRWFWTAGATLVVAGFSQSLVSGVAAAADIALAPPPFVETWSGFYAGIHGGGGAFTGMAMDWDYDVFDDPDGDIDLNGFAGLLGGQVGYNHQVGNILYGVEADIAWTNFSEEKVFDDDYYVKAEMDWLATVRGRLGVASGNAMAYVTGGLAIAQLNHCGNDDHEAPCSTDDDENIAWDGVKLGLVAGAGVETRLSENLSLKGEYLFVQMDKENVVYDTGSDEDIDFSNRAHLLRIGLNYHFNGLPLAEPVDTGGAWSGFYAGAQGGVGAFTGTAMDWDRNIFADPDGDFDLNGFAGLLGGQVGYNHQVGNIVYGAEADIAWTGFSEEKVFDGDESYVKAEMDWLATVRGRMGLTVGNAMAYVTGGLAIAQLNHCGNDDPDAPCSVDNEENTAWDGVQLGLVAGAGVETRLSNRLSLKGEYLFVQMDKENVVYDTDEDYDIDFSNQAHLLRIGLNYHFNDLPLAEPVETGGAWSGFYAGIHGGGGAFTGTAMDWNYDVFDDPDGDVDLNGFAGLLGGQVGYNHQVGNIVYGAEADIAWTGFSEEKVFDDDYYVKAEMDWLATVRGRMGLTVGNAMAYATGGLAIAQLNHCGNDDYEAPCSIDDDDNIAWDGVKLGLVAGAGVETRLSERLSLKGEYLFVQMDKENIVYDTGSDEDIDFSNRAHLFRIGLNYRFGS